MKKRRENKPVKLLRCRTISFFFFSACSASIYVHMCLKYNSNNIYVLKVYNYSKEITTWKDLVKSL